MCIHTKSKNISSILLPWKPVRPSQAIKIMGRVCSRYCMFNFFEFLLFQAVIRYTRRNRYFRLLQIWCRAARAVQFILASIVVTVSNNLPASSHSRRYHLTSGHNTLYTVEPGCVDVECSITGGQSACQPYCEMGHASGTDFNLFVLVHVSQIWAM